MWRFSQDSPIGWAAARGVGQAAAVAPPAVDVANPSAATIQAFDKSGICSDQIWQSLLVSVEELEALDFMIWLRTGQAAGHVLRCNQSTVSRRIRRVLEAFNGVICREGLGLTVRSECDELLLMERQIHQLYRLGNKGRLRINVPAWSHRLIHQLLSEHGFCSNAEAGFCCENPLQLLRSHVIDACVITPTQLDGEATNDLVQIVLYEMPIHMYCLPDRSLGVGPGGSGDRSVLVAHGQRALALAPFLPQSCRRAAQRRFAQLLVDAGAGPKARHRPSAGPCPQLTFATPVMARLLPGAVRLRHDLQWPYSERLVVLRSLVEQPRLQQLISDIAGRLGPLTHNLADLELEPQAC